MINFSVKKDASGKVIGYSVRPGNAPEAFAEAGLKPGDVVTAVNGYEASDPDVDQHALFKELATTSEITMDVIRGSQNLTFVISVDD